MWECGFDSHSNPEIFPRKKILGLVYKCYSNVPNHHNIILVRLLQYTMSMTCTTCLLITFKINLDTRNRHDYDMLQADVDTPSTWVTSNNLSLNTTKCKFMVITRLRKKSILVPLLTLNNQLLERVSSLGVTITEDLSWSIHVNDITKKARKHVGLLYRQFYAWSTPEALLQLYKSIL